MARPGLLPTSGGLPLWDTFEVAFVLLAGVVIGLALGILLPSLWRTFRRRFRDTRRVESDDLPQGTLVESPLEVLRDDPDDAESETGGRRGAMEAALRLRRDERQLRRAFIDARDAVHEGRLREAVSIYVSIFGNERVSQAQTCRALFELSQVYFRIGLETRGFELGLELLSRKPRREDVFRFLLARYRPDAIQGESLARLSALYRGPLPAPVRRKLAHAQVLHAAHLASAGNVREAFETAKRALRTDTGSARARLLLWRLTSADLWRESPQDAPGLIEAFRTDLDARARIAAETGISPWADAETLATLFERLAGHWELSQMLLAGQSDPPLLFSGLASRTHDRNARRALATAVVSALALPATRAQESAWSLAFALLGPAHAAKIRAIAAVPAAEDAPYDCFVLFRRGAEAHRCRECAAERARFEWSCPACSAAESLEPLQDLG